MSRLTQVVAGRGDKLLARRRLNKRPTTPATATKRPTHVDCRQASLWTTFLQRTGLGDQNQIHLVDRPTQPNMKAALCVLLLAAATACAFAQVSPGPLAICWHPPFAEYIGLQVWGLAKDRRYTMFMLPCKRKSDIDFDKASWADPVSADSFLAIFPMATDQVCLQQGHLSSLYLVYSQYVCLALLTPCIRVKC